MWRSKPESHQGRRGVRLKRAYGFSQLHWVWEYQRKDIDLNNKKSYMMDQIRSIMLEQAKKHPEYAYHITSDLNWLRYEMQIDYLGNLLPHGSRVLELGCGWGQTTAMLAIKRPDITVVGIDINKSKTWQELAKFGCSFKDCDAARLPFDSSDFDSIVSFGVIEHVDKEFDILKEIYRCLISGGYNIIFQLPNKYSLSEFAGRKFRIWHHERLYRLEEIKRLLTKNDFEILNIELEHFIPSQVSRINTNIGKILNNNCDIIYKIDRFLCNTPLSFFFRKILESYPEKIDCERPELLFRSWIHIPIFFHNSMTLRA